MQLTRDDPTSFSPPSAFGPFRVLHQIGIGVLGPVFRTYDPQRDRLVAVKVFRLDITPEQGRELADEFERIAAMALSHPAVVAPIAAGVEETAAYLALEYVAAESLDVAMRHYSPATLEKVLPFIRQLAGGIDFVSAAGVRHGTLHPRDIFVTPDVARATGFGVAQALEHIGYRPPVRRPYSAPERVAAGGEWTNAADVFSLAALTHELLTGHRLVGVGEQSMAADADFGPDVDADAVRAVLTRALAEDPAERYATASAFASALKSAAHTATVVAPVSLPLFVSELSPPQLQQAPPAKTEVVAATPEVPASLDVSTVAHVRDVSVRPIADTMLRPVSAAVADERPRPAMVPYALTAMVSLLVGFAIGYGIGNLSKERAPSDVTVAETPTPAQPAAPVATPTAVAPPAAAEVSGPLATATGIAPPAAAEAPGPSAAVPPAGSVAARPERSDTASPGRMLVRSTPAGAEVLVDGKPRGVTPLALRDLAYGTYAVRVTRAGYITETRRVVVSRNRPAASVTISLRQQRAPVTGGAAGAIFVDSQPRGGRVQIDGRAAGTTPLLISSLAAGTHVVQIEHDGYKAWSTSVRLGTGGERARVTASLERLP